MLGAFWWEQPGWLVAVLAATGALVVHLRLAPTAGGRPTRRRALARLAAGLGAGAAAAGLGAWLMYLGSSAALVLLGILAGAAAVWLTIALHRRQRDAASPLSRTVLAGLRTLAWVMLLILLARPVWDWGVTDWHKPLLVVLLDQSESMALVDAMPETDQTRAQLANASFGHTRAAIRRLDALCEVRLRGVGAGHDALGSWEIVPQAPLSALAAAVREAGEMRSRRGAAPLAVLLVSDGAENVHAPGELRQAGAELAAQGIALWAVGVGPAPGQTPLVELEPLTLPARLGLRDRLRVPAAARVQGCAGAAVIVELLWDDQPTAARPLRIDYDIQHVQSEFDAVPPSAGVHRLSVRLTLPQTLGGSSFETSAIVDVRDERVRVLWLEGAPRVEAAFATRALRGVPQLELTRRFVFDEAETRSEPSGAEALTWTDYDVVVLGSIPPALSDARLEDLARAVTERGVGLLLLGGRRLFNDANYGRTALGDVSPVELVSDEFGLAGPLRFVPTEAGLRHPILRGVGAAETSAAPARPVDEQATWQGLPPLGGAALLGPPKPAAAVLGEDADGRPLLVTQEVGRGRSVAAAWESSWAWALASDEGAALHRQVWRQLLTWLANRRPRAWVLTDRPTYPLAALAAGQRRVQIQAGISGLTSNDRAARLDGAQVRLVLAGGDERRELPLRRRGRDWVAEWPSRSQGAGSPAPGEYGLEFVVTGRDGPVDEERLDLEARTNFALVDAPIERQPPTANLGLLRAAAEETAAHGGSYHGIQELPELLEGIAQTDRRREVRTRVRYGAVEREPWVVLAALLAALGLEWTVRKRIGLA